MKAAELRSDLLKKIETMNLTQLKEFYGVLQNYFNNSDLQEEWTMMTPKQRSKIEKGFPRADAGRVKTQKEISTRLRKKYSVYSLEGFVNRHLNRRDLDRVC